MQTGAFKFGPAGAVAVSKNLCMCLNIKNNLFSWTRKGKEHVLLTS